MANNVPAYRANLEARLLAQRATLRSYLAGKAGKRRQDYITVLVAKIQAIKVELVTIPEIISGPMPTPSRGRRAG